MNFSFLHLSLPLGLIQFHFHIPFPLHLWLKRGGNEVLDGKKNRGENVKNGINKLQHSRKSCPQCLQTEWIDTLHSRFSNWIKCDRGTNENLGSNQNGKMSWIKERKSLQISREANGRKAWSSFKETSSLSGQFCTQLFSCTSYSSYFFVIWDGYTAKSSRIKVAWYMNEW